MEMHTIQKSIIKKLVFVFLIFFIIQLFLGIIILCVASFHEITNYLTSIAQRVQDDLIYRNGTWDIYRYTADPKLPDTYPLYILASDGYVIDRWKPLKGFLDLSDFQHLIAYQTPQNIKTPTDQNWRMYTKNITSNNETIGVIVVAKYNPDTTTLDVTDQQLQQTAKTLFDEIQIKGTSINTNTVDPRDIPYNISFQIVNKYNKILLKNNNSNSIDQLPNYIDRSYIGSAITNTSSQMITDTGSGEHFIIISKPIFDTNYHVVGVIVVGHSIEDIYQIMKIYILSQIGIAISLMTGFSIASGWLLKKDFNKFPKQQKLIKTYQEITSIRFDKKQNLLFINDQTITIPYATNQYYMCEALFTYPQKKMGNR